jgi:hypothetical protein
MAGISVTNEIAIIAQSRWREPSTRRVRIKVLSEALPAPKVSSKFVIIESFECRHEDPDLLVLTVPVPS